jgi:hypothetical protein
MEFWIMKVFDRLVIPDKGDEIDICEKWVTPLLVQMVRHSMSHDAVRVECSASFSDMVHIVTDDPEGWTIHVDSDQESENAFREMLTACSPDKEFLFAYGERVE